MSVAHHTPGKWHTSLVSDKYWNVGVYDESGTEVALIKVKSMLQGNRRDADARLMAAAPELLAALCTAEKFMRIASDWNIDEAEIDGEMRSTYEWLETINFAIAKATGSTT